MTLSRQFVTLLIIMFFLVFTCNYWSVLSNTREYLSLQLKSHAQDAATSLGLSLTPYTDSESIMESMINAIFDSGDYSDIRLVDLEGNTVINKHNEIRADVPDWFSGLLPLNTPEAETLITTGWQQKFNLLVRSDPSYAYRVLWKTACNSFIWTLEAFAVALLLMILFIRILLRPLRAVEDHANRICNRDFPDPMYVPRTRELRRVAGAMNRMSSKVKEMLDSLSETAAALRKDLHIDTLTGLLNRKGFMAVIHQHKTDESLPSQGHFALISLTGLNELNVNKGYSEGDGALTMSTEIIERTCKLESFSESVIARVGGSDFALLMPGVNSEMIADHLAGLCSEMNSKLERYAADLSVHIGIAEYGKKLEFGELCKLADRPLSKAQNQGLENPVCYAESDLHVSRQLGKQDWRNVIHEALEKGNLSLAVQQILFVNEQDKSRMLYEACAKITDDKGLNIIAGDFIFWAERLNLIERLDQRMITLALARLEQDDTIGLSVNISELSIISDPFLEWLEKTLQENHKIARRLVFELPEKGVLAHLGKAQRLAEVSKKYDMEIAIDRFGVSRSSIDYLRQVKPDLLKIDGSYLHDIENDVEDQVMLRAYVDIGHGLDMKVIATFIETESACEAVKKLGVDGIQGLVLGRPV